MAYNAEYQRDYYLRNKAQRQATCKAYREANKDKLRKYAIGYHQSKSHEQKILDAARKRAQRDAIPFDITADDIVIPNRCPVLDIEIVCGQSKHNDNSPSLDRIVPSLGYVRGNVTVMSNRANRIKNDGTASEHEAIARWQHAQARAT